MNKWVVLTAFAIATLGFAAETNPASAQATRTWVSGVGDDANPCSRTAPCKTFAGAISKTAAGGEINAIDPGGFGAVTITKSITIDTSNTVGGVLNASSSGVIVNGGANDVIVLRGLDIDSATSGTGLNGVRFIAGSALHIEDSVIRDNKSTGTNGFGVQFAPGSGTAKLFISNTVISGNGNEAANTGGGIEVRPTGSGSALVTIENSSLNNNNRGILVEGGSTTGSINMSIVNAALSGNSRNAVNVNGGNAVLVMIDSSVIINNSGSGLRTTGNSIARIGRSTITGNQSGLVVAAGGQIQSYGDNFVNGNGTDGSPTSTIAPQ